MCIFSNLGAYRRMYTGCLPPIVYAVMPGFVECSSSDAKPGDSFTAEALQSFSSRMVKRACGSISQ